MTQTAKLIEYVNMTVYKENYLSMLVTFQGSLSILV